MAGSEKVTFEGAHGVELAGRLDRPSGPSRATALFAHCFTCSKDVHAASRIARALTERGLAVLRFDFTGLGGSDGEFANTDFSSNVEDLLAAAAFLRDRGEAPALLVGHSLGGAAVLKAAAEVPEAAGVATIGAPADPEHVTRNFAMHVDDIRREGEGEVTLAGRTFRIRREFLDDLTRHDMPEAIRNMGKALLVLHAPRDQVVDVDNARRIFEAALHPKSFVSLDDADHLLSRPEDAEYVAAILAAWAGRYLPEHPAAVAVGPQPAQGEVRIVEAGEGTFPQVVLAGRHELRADEPVSVGGTDTGPDPYSYLQIALGTCTAMTIRLYADRKGYPLKHVEVDLAHGKIHAEDCKECETRQGKLDRIERRVRLQGPLDKAQRQELLRIADRCPVHRTLTSEIRIETRLDDGE